MLGGINLYGYVGNDPINREGDLVWAFKFVFAQLPSPTYTGLYYYRARYYSPSQQRFINEDSIGLLGGINLYGYVGNDPISYSDPFGLDKNDSRDDGGPGIGEALKNFVDSVKDFLINTLLPAAAMEASGPIMHGLAQTSSTSPSDKGY